MRARLNRRRRGFSLIEAAIVLGIVGLVIGGIWVAASAVQNQLRNKTMLEMLATAREKAQALKAPFAATALSFNFLGDVLRRVALPGDYEYLYSLTDGPLIKNGSAAWLFYLSKQSGRVFFGIEVYYTSDIFGGVYRPQPSMCLELSKRLMNAGMGSAPASPGYSISWDAGSNLGTWDGAAAPLDPTTLTTYCNSAQTMYALWEL